MLVSFSEGARERKDVEEGDKYVGKHAVLLAGDLAPLHGLPDAVVAALHEPALEADGIAQVGVCLDIAAAALARGQDLELGVELIIEALGEQEEEVEACDLVALGDVEGVGGELVEGRELGHVAGEGVRVRGADGGQCALLVSLAGEGEEGGVSDCGGG